jgi:hypothetical protein
LTQPRPTDQQIGVTLTRVHFLAKVDPGVYHALRRITDAMVELKFRLADGDYQNALRPTDPDGAGAVSGSRDLEEPMWQRALHPLRETEQARADHQTAAEQLTKTATSLEVCCGWADPPKGRQDRRGRQLIQSLGPDGERRVG